MAASSSSYRTKKYQSAVACSDATRVQSETRYTYRGNGRNRMFSVRTRTVLVCLIAITIASTPGFARAQGGQGGQAGRRAGGDQITTIEERTNGLKKIDGFFPLYVDEAAGKLWLEIPKLDTEVLYSTGLATGLGSNDIGLDRGILTGSRIVKFERAGPK